MTPCFTFSQEGVSWGWSVCKESVCPMRLDVSAGVHCESRVFDCSAHSCVNNATCRPSGALNYTCQCRPNHHGHFCQFTTGNHHVHDMSQFYAVEYNYVWSVVVFPLLCFIHRVSENKQNYFCYNCVKFAPNLIIFGTKTENSLKLYEVRSFSTSPHLPPHLVNALYRAKRIFIYKILFTLLLFSL